MRCNSPLDTIVKNGVEGVIIGDGLQAENGTMGYFVRFAARDLRDAKAGVDGPASVFCAASRLRAVSAVSATG